MVKLSVLAIAAFVTMVAAEPPIGGGYSYHQPAPLIISGGGGHGGGHGGGISLGGGFSLGGHGGLGGGGGYRAVHSGYQTSEGQYVDPQLLEEIKHILLNDEIKNSQYRSSSFSSGHGLSGSYGAPSPVYGVPHYEERIVGIELGHVKQGLQVAQYEQDGGYSGGGYASGYSGGYSGGHSSEFSGGHSSGFSGGHSGGFSGGLSGGFLGGHSGGLSFGGGLSDGGFSGGHGGISVSSGYSAPSGGNYHTIAVPAGTYGVPLPSHH